MFFGRSRETQDISLEQLNRKVTQMDEELKKTSAPYGAGTEIQEVSDRRIYRKAG